MVQPGKQPAPKVPLNNLGKVIQRRKELNISQEKIGHIVGLGSRQAWSSIEQKYNKSIKSTKIKLNKKQNAAIKKGF